MDKFCTKCGTKIVDGTSYCPNCGAFVGNNPQPTPASHSNQKSKIAAGLLGIFLGGLGVHNFYLGYTGKAIAQLLISLLSFGFLSPVSSLWGLIEGIMILVGSINVDGNGIPLTE